MLIKVIINTIKLIKIRESYFVSHEGIS